MQHVEVSFAVRRTYKYLGFKGLSSMSLLYSVSCMILTSDNC